MNRQSREKGYSSWFNCGPVGFIEAAKLYAIECEDDNMCIEVRDEEEPEAIYTFEMKREVTYQCLNPRQGAE